MSGCVISKHPQFAKLARQLRSQGYGFRGIAEELTKKGLEVSHVAVQTYLNTVMDVQARIIGQDDVIEQQVREEILDSTKQMKQINEELWSIVNTLKKEAEQAEDKTKALSVAVKALDRITALVELNNKISGRITNNHVTVNNSYLDMSTNLNVHLKKVFNDLTKRGVITVNKPEELPIL